MILVIGEKYENVKVNIDVSSFHFTGPVLYSIDDWKTDSYISFRCDDSENVDEVVERIRKALRLTVDKEKYVTCRKEFESYEKDKRPRITVRLPSGFNGLASPPEFYFK